MLLGLSLACKHGRKLEIYVCLGTGGSRVDNGSSDKTTLLQSDVEVDEMDWVVSSQEYIADVSRIIGSDSGVPG